MKKEHNLQLMKEFLTTQNKSHNQYKSAINKFIQYVGERDLMSLTPDDVISFMLISKANMSYINTFLKWVYVQSDTMQNFPMIQYLLPSDCKELIKF